MAPVVHGLEREYEGKVDFVYLNVAEERNAEAKRTYGFRATPHSSRRRGSPHQVSTRTRRCPSPPLHRVPHPRS